MYFNKAVKYTNKNYKYWVFIYKTPKKREISNIKTEQKKTPFLDFRKSHY